MKESREWCAGYLQPEDGVNKERTRHKHGVNKEQTRHKHATNPAFARSSPSRSWQLVFSSDICSLVALAVVRVAVALDIYALCHLSCIPLSLVHGVQLPVGNLSRWLETSPFQGATPPPPSILVSPVLINNRPIMIRPCAKKVSFFYGGRGGVEGG